MKYIKYLIVVLTYVITNGANAQWFWQNPLPQGNFLNDIKLINKNIGYAIGSWGTVIKTTDAGVTWKEKEFPVRNRLNAACFINESIGWVVGDTGIVAKTLDGGSSWSLLNSGTVQKLNNIYFLNEQRGFILGDWNTFLISTDGGLTWVEKNHNGRFANFYDIVFVNESIGWVSGGQTNILKTTDGGENWIQQYENNFNWEITEIDFVDEQNGWAICPYLNSRLFKTTDSGHNWSVELINTSINNAFIYDLHFVDMNLGFLVGGIGGTRGIIFKSLDGGNNWFTIRDSTSDYLTAIDLIENNGIAIGGREILKSNDNGNSWKLISKRLNLFIVNDAEFINKSVAYLSAKLDKKIFKTIDGGNTWSYTEVPSMVNEIDFVDELRGWATCDSGGILYTSDGGETWIVQVINSAENSPKNIFFINDQVGWALSIDTLIQTTDGGNNWNLKYTFNYHNSPLSMFFINQNYGWLVFYDKLLKTTNGGSNWEEISNPSQYSLQAVKFNDENIGWVVGREIYKTSDGGENWIQQQTLNNQTLNQIEIINENIIWAVGGDGGYLWYTENGGDEWKSIVSRIPGNIVTLNFVDEKFGWIVGFVGQILNTTNGGASYNQDFPIDDYLLFQNYPNPFNSSTKINWQLPNPGWQTLIIYDILGREVVKLVDEYRFAGAFEVEWNASNYASGVYLYRLNAGSYFETRKMILIR